MGIRRDHLSFVTSRRLQRVGIALVITVLAGIPRLLRPDLAEYKLDESLAVLNGLAILRGEALPFTGQGSSLANASQGPLFYYAVAAILAIGHNPIVVVVAIGVVNALAVGLTFLVTDQWFSRRVALVASLLFAGSSWDIVFSRKIWPNDLLAPLAVIALWGLLRALDPRTREPGLGRSWVAVALMGSLNLSGWPLVFVPALVQVAIPRTRRGRACWWSCAGLIVLLAAVVVEARTLGVILNDVATPSAHEHFLDLSPLSFIVQLVEPDAFFLLAGPANPFPGNASLIDGLGLALRALLILGAVGVIARITIGYFQRGGRVLTPEGLVLLWWLFPALAAIDRPVQVYIHHFLGTMPTQFILVAFGIDTLPRWAMTVVTRGCNWLGLHQITGSRIIRGVHGERRRWAAFVHVVGTAGALIVYVMQVHAFAVLLAFISVHPADTFFGVPLTSSLVAARVATAASRRGPVYLLSEGDLVGVDTLPTVLASLEGSARLGNLNVAHTFLFPSVATDTYLVAPGNVDEIQGALAPWQAGGYLSRLTILPGGYGLFTGQPVGVHVPIGWQQLSIESVDGARLTGYTVPRQIQPGGTLTVEVTWQIGQPDPRPEQESVFAHLVDDQGRRIAGEDFSPLPTVTWRSGETILNVFQLAVPPTALPGRYWIDFGRYRRPSMQHIGFVSTGESDDLTSIRLGPLAVPPPQPDLPELTPAQADFGGQIQLTGWRARPSGDRLVVDLLWTALRPPIDDYTVFVHLVGPDERIVAQHDSQPLEGQFPTSTWKAGDQILDTIELPSGTASEADDRVVVGLYTLSTGQRLAVGRSDSLTLDAR